MKRLLLIILICSANFCNAQNYQCLQAGVKHYFINGNGYLRGIRIDAIDTLGDTIVYYPFQTPRGTYGTGGYPFLAYGGSWLGKKVRQLNDGTFVFDSYWNDSVIIKTQANIGDSWDFYRDSSSLYYKATVISKDTMTVLSVPDSIKTIMITANNGTGIVPSDPLDSFKIILSKNHGFVQVFDLYTFPYHKPDSAYRIGLDFFLDRSTCTSSNINFALSTPVMPNPNITIFKLVDFINPNTQQLYNWDSGDVIRSSHFYGISPMMSYNVSEEILDTVSSKSLSGSLAILNLVGSAGTCSFTGYTHYPCTFVSTRGVYYFSSSIYPLMDTSYMPEEQILLGNYLFYIPNDTSYCSHSPVYVVEPANFYAGGLGSEYDWSYFKLGIGLTYYYHWDGDSPNFEQSHLIYYNMHGTRCGTPPDTVAVIDSSVSVIETQKPSSNYYIFPNPTNKSITISSNNPITSVIIFNPIGQEVVSNKYYNKSVQIDVANLPSGIYLIRINGTEVRKFVKE